MGNAYLYYYPTGGSLRSVDLGGCLTDLQVSPVVAAGDQESIGGRMYQQTHYSRQRVSIALVGITDAALVRQLYGVQDHLARGGWIGIAEDHDDAFAGYVSNTKRLKDGQTKVRFHSNPFWNQSAGIASSDAVEILRLEPPILRHRDLLSAASVKIATLTDGITGDLSAGGGAILIRNRGFWPALRQRPGARGAKILTTTRRLHYSLAMELDEDIEVIRAMSAIGSGTFAAEVGKPGRTPARVISRKLGEDVKTTVSVTGRTIRK